MDLLQHLGEDQHLQDDTHGAVQIEDTADQTQDEAEEGQDLANKTEQEGNDQTGNQINHDADDQVLNRTGVLKGNGEELFQSVHGIDSFI